MKILFLISGWQVPASRFRVLPYVPYLRKGGHQCRVSASFPPKYQRLPFVGWKASGCVQRLCRWFDLFHARVCDFDTIFLEREIFDTDSVFFEEQFRKVAHTMVLDVDDAIFLKHPAKFDALVGLSDRVIVGNRLLGERVAKLNAETVLIPTCVDIDRYPLKKPVHKPEKPLIVGWTGTSSNLPYLRLIQESLRRLATRCRFELRIIADSDQPLQFLDLTGVNVHFQRWQETTEIEDLLACDIGIMPLVDEEWAKYKCGLKAIQYMAIGIPCVISPVGVNSDIVVHNQNGFLAADLEQWEDLLYQLLHDGELRVRIGQEGRRTVEEHYSVQKHVSAFEQAVCQRASHPHRAKTSAR